MVNIKERVTEFETYINDILKEDLRKLQLRLDKINAEIADLIQQRHTLKAVTNKEIHPTGFKTQLNLGCNFFMEASVTDTSKALINIGLGHYLECTIVETNMYINSRLKVLERNSKEIDKRSAEIKAHIKLMLFGLGQLQEDSNQNSRKTK